VVYGVVRVLSSFITVDTPGMDMAHLMGRFLVSFSFHDCLDALMLMLTAFMIVSFYDEKHVYMMSCESSIPHDP
jgi:hypothetical protein